MDTDLLDVRSKPAQQQPDWGDDPHLPTVHRELATRPPLVGIRDTDRLRGLLARVAAGEAQVILAGDCSEDPAECSAGDVLGKTGLVEMLAGLLRVTTRRPVVRAARIAGQYAKPRSCPTERVGGRDLPSYRGHMVNSPEPDLELRAFDPTRILAGYDAARSVMFHLGWLEGPASRSDDAPVWTGHEALLLDYELPMLRRSTDGRTVLASTHWPWVGERTRVADGAHVALLAGIANPVACKVGPSAEPGDVLELCERLDEGREPGRLTLVSRMGAGAVAERLPPLVEAVQRAGHPVIWLTDPMHGNTVATASGVKTRYVEDIVREVREFQAVVRASGGVPGGLHLEATPDRVTECVADPSHEAEVTGKYTTLCDPRLNPDQAAAVVSAWST